MTEYLLLKYDHKETDSVEQKMKEHLNFYMLFLNSEIELPGLGNINPLFSEENGGFAFLVCHAYFSFLDNPNENE